MGVINPNLPTIGQPNSTEDVDLLNALQAILNVINGNVDAGNIKAGSITADQLTTQLRAAAGVSDASTVRRGKSVIPTEESRSNTAYGLLTTPDRVSGVVMPTDGLILVAYQALWKESVSGTARAAVFLGSNQVKVRRGAAVNNTEAFTSSAATANVYRALASAPHGLTSDTSNTGAAAEVTTGMLVGFYGQDGADASGQGGAVSAQGYANGPFMALWAAAGTYDVSVQFKASSGSVTVKDRRLWVWTVGF